MCDLDTYRARIGSFNCKSWKSRTPILFNIMMRANLSIFNLMHITLLLLLSGDIEVNPGPRHQLRDNLSDISSSSSLGSNQNEEKHLNILHINAESLRKKVNAVEAESIGYDIVCLTETWLNPSIDNTSISLTGFQQPFRKDRGDGYGGVAIYVAEHIPALQRTDLDTQDLEAIWVEIRHPKLRGLFCSMYRPPNTNVNYWNLIDESLEKARNSGIDHQFLLGDLNSDQFKRRNRLQLLLEKYNFTQLIRDPTHIKLNSSKCIDIIATNSRNLITSSGTMPPLASNHKPVYAILNIEKPRQKTYKRQIWQTKNVDWDKLNEDLASQDWSTVMKKGNVNNILEAWTELYLTTVKRHVKRLTVTVRPREAKWMTPEIRSMIRKRNRLHKIAKSKDTETSWNNYKRIRNDLKDKIRSTKKDYDDRISERINQGGSTNPKTWWALVKDFYSKTANKQNMIKLLLVNGIAITDDIAKANALNNFFIDQTKINTNGTDPPNLPKPTSTLNTINIRATTVKDIIEIINTSKSCGPDPITPVLIKNTGKTIAPILSQIFNYSIKSSCFPDHWKLAHVMPIHKKGEETQCKNYRPISLLPCLAKVFERCVFKEVFNYLTANERLSKLQAAYSPCNSTEFQLLELYHLIAKSMDDNKTIRFVFCDVSKAFDKVWHAGLLEKLNAMGIGGGLLKWFESYLKCRKQCVVLNGTKSEIQELKAGVPQGSILGPLLFLVYINDLCDVVQSNIRLYADDSILFVTGTNQQQIANTLNEDLERISQWAATWYVTFNPNKTEDMLITNKQVNNVPILLLNQTPILQVQSHKHLGCTLDKNLRWKSHINEIITKAGRRVDILRGLKYRFNRKTLEILYKSFIRPILEYSQTVWTNCTIGQKQAIEQVQLSAIRVITGGIRNTSHRKLYEEVDLIPTSERQDRTCLVVFYKIYHGHTPTYLKELLPPRTHTRTNYNLRNLHDLSTYNNRTATFYNSYFPKYTRKWNELETKSKFIGSLPDFKRLLQKQDKKTPNYYYTGERKWQIIHTRMRLGCSPLSADLHDLNIIDSSRCDCGYLQENVFHFFFVCPQYTHIRHLFHNIHPSIQQNVKHFLKGKVAAPKSLNVQLFEIVLEYIKLSNRF